MTASIHHPVWPRSYTVCDGSKVRYRCVGGKGLNCNGGDDSTHLGMFCCTSLRVRSVTPLCEGVDQTR